MTAITLTTASLSGPQRQKIFTRDELVRGLAMIPDVIYPAMAEHGIDGFNILVFGGFAMMAAGTNLRETTEDIDAMVPSPLFNAIEETVDIIADPRQNNWNRKWLNSQVAEVICEHDCFRNRDAWFDLWRTFTGIHDNKMNVYVPKPEFMLASKLGALRFRGNLEEAGFCPKDDTADILNLAHATGITDPKDLCDIVLRYDVARYHHRDHGRETFLRRNIRIFTTLNEDGLQPRPPSVVQASYGVQYAL